MHHDDEEEGMHHDDEEEGMHHDDEEEGHHGHGHDHGHFEYDPHIWLDPVLVKQQVNNIRDALILADPASAELYERNASAYSAELDALDAAGSTLSECRKDTFVSFHSAFAYFAKRYGLDVIALGGLAPDAEASASEMAGFVDFVRGNDIKVVFAEELVDPRLAEAIAEESGARVMILSPIEGLTPEEESAGVTYLDKMEQNLANLRVALECQ